MGDDDSLTHVSGHVIIAVTSLCCGCRAEIERRDGNFFMLRFQLGANPWLTYCLVVVVVLELRCVCVTYRRPSWNNFRFLLSLQSSLSLSHSLSPIWRHIPSHMSGRLRQSSGCRTRCLSSGASLALITALPRVGFISALVQVTWQSQASAKMSINFRCVSRRLIEFFCLSSRLQFATVRCKVMTVIDCQSTSVKWVCHQFA